MGDFLVQDGQTVVFAGDSITDVGRRAQNAPYGAGYVKFAIDLITARYPTRKISYVNVGIGGNTVADLRARWYDDVLYYNPDWVTILVGINDLHRTLAGADTAVPPDKYEQLYREIIELTRDKAGAEIVLLDPFYISGDTETGSHRSRVLELLPDYLGVVAKLAEEYGLRRVPMHDVYMEHVKYRPPETFCPEPVHPGPTGHLIMALELLKVLGW